MPQILASNNVFKNFLQVSGKNLQVNLKSDLLNATEFAYNDKIRVKISVTPDSKINDVKVLSSSGSSQIDDIVLQCIKETMQYINIPPINGGGANNKIYNLKLVINF